MKKPLCIYHGNCADGFGAACRETGLDPAYLHRLRYGTKSNPSKETLKKLGVKIK